MKINLDIDLDKLSYSSIIDILCFWRRYNGISEMTDVIILHTIDKFSNCIREVGYEKRTDKWYICLDDKIGFSVIYFDFYTKPSDTIIEKYKKKKTKWIKEF